MDDAEFAARLVAIEQRLDEVSSMLRMLFQDVVDSLPSNDVD